MKQTAVEYLAEKYNYITWLRNRDEISTGTADEMRTNAYIQAKEMERHQILDAYRNGWLNFPAGNDGWEYYDETFNTNEK